MLSYFVNYGVNQSIPSTEAKQWRIPFALQMLPGALLLAGIFFQSESPRWLVEKNRISDARKALSQIRSRPQDDPEVDRELEDIVDDFNGHEKMPLLAQMHISLLHFGVLLDVTSAAGLIIPPLGFNLYIASHIAGTPVEKAAKASIPYLIATIVVAAVIVFVPSLSTWLPGLVHT